MTVYIDEVFFVNFISDFFLLMLVRKIINKNCGVLRIISASFMLSILSTMFCLTDYSNLVNAFLPLLTVKFTFTPNSLRSFIQYMLCFYCSSIALGGVTLLVKNIVGGMNFVLLVLSLFSGCFLFSLLCPLGRKFNLKSKETVNITIIKNGLEVNVPSVIDTGNSLYDFISRRPVIVTDYISVKSLLPENVRTAFEAEVDPIEIFSIAPLELRLIPYKSVGVKHGRIIGFRADKIYSDTKEIDAIIGISPYPVSANNEYNGLVSPIVYV